jgi:hypothetical protein
LLEITKSRAVATAYNTLAFVFVFGWKRREGRAIPKANAPDKILFSTIPPLD